MKKSLIVIILFTALLMTGCGKKEQMTNFIPTPIPNSEDNGGDTTEVVTDDGEVTGGEVTDATPTPKALHVGQTTPMYVKLDEYDAILNVRSTPSKDGDVVGFLVHTEKIDVIDIVDGWASFAQGGEVRYVSSDFLVKDRPEYLEPPTAAPTSKPTAKPTSTPAPTPKPAQSDTPAAGSEEAPPEI